MFCPNCGAKMNRNYCSHCGYMPNENFIGSAKNQDDPLLSYYFGDKYDTYVRNQNWYVPGILGPIYIISHNFYIVGILLFIIDIAISLGILVFNHMFLFTYVVCFIDIVYFIINRFVWATIGNIIYIKLLSRKLESEKKNNPGYKELLADYKKVDFAFYKTKCILFSIVGIGIFLILKEFIYSYLLIS